MTYTVVVFVTRKPGLTPQQFKEHYDNVHIPLIRGIAGPLFPLSHTRRYISRSQSDAQGTNTTRNATTPAHVILGSQADFDYDAIVEMVFPDEKAFQDFFKHVHGPEHGSTVIADEERFIDRAELRVAILGSTETTGRGEY
ncbi:EthD domain-containing protein [Hypoxylon sp. NC1633]|nr:EthD domain-containing protein [Hypoxylon sp. NC1633]